MADDERFSTMAGLLHLAHFKIELFHPDTLSELTIEMEPPKPPEEEWQSLVKDYWQTMLSIVSGRRACVTEKGLFGLILEPVCVGDEIWMILDGGGPVIL